MNFCIHCGNEIQPEQKFCPDCGKPNTQLVAETSVAKPINTKNDKVCPKCGSSKYEPFHGWCEDCGDIQTTSGQSSETNPQVSNSNLTSCPACKKQVGITANQCPHCGTSLKKSKITELFRSSYFRIFLVFLSLQGVSVLLDSEITWKPSRIISIISFMIPMGYLYLKNRGQKLNNKYKVVQVAYGIGFIFGILSFIQSSNYEKEKPKIIQNEIAKYWEDNTYEWNGYRYSLYKMEAGNAMGNLSPLIRFDRTDRIGFYSYGISPNVEIKFPRYEYIYYSNGGYGNGYEWTSKGGIILGFKGKLTGNKIQFTEGIGLTQIVKDSIIIKEALRDFRLRQ